MNNYVAASLLLKDNSNSPDLTGLDIHFDSIIATTSFMNGNEEVPYKYHQFGFEYSQKTYELRLEYKSQYKGKLSQVSVNLDWDFFLPGREIGFSPKKNRNKFSKYKEILTFAIRKYQPLLGVIDFDADVFEAIQEKNLTSWGVYLANDLYKLLKGEELQIVKDLSSEINQIEEYGYIIWFNSFGYTLTEDPNKNLKAFSVINKLFNSLNI